MTDILSRKSGLENFTGNSLESSAKFKGGRDSLSQTMNNNHQRNESLNI